MTEFELKKELAACAERDNKLFIAKFKLRQVEELRELVLSKSKQLAEAEEALRRVLQEIEP